MKKFANRNTITGCPLLFIVSSKTMRQQRGFRIEYKIYKKTASETCDFRGCFGPSSAARTHGLLVPNQARYQLRYTRIFNFCHYTTTRGKIRDFSACGQSRFNTVFGNRQKSSKRRCHKTLRRFLLPRPGYSHGTFKAGAVPTPPYPVGAFAVTLYQTPLRCARFFGLMFSLHYGMMTQEKAGG